MFGALISATDPVTVLSIFQVIGCFRLVIAILFFLSCYLFKLSYQTRKCQRMFVVNKELMRMLVYGRTPNSLAIQA